MIVVTDTSVILNLCFLAQQKLLPALFEVVITPPEVKWEFERLAFQDDRFFGLVFPEFIAVKAPQNTLPSLRHTKRLQVGEISAISLAVEIKAGVVLMDERAGRLAASELGLQTLGLLGVLLEAHKNGMIGSLKPFLDRLQNEARFWISPSVRQQVLRLAGE